MRFYAFIFLLFITVQSLAQGNMEQECLENIRSSSSRRQFLRYSGPIVISGDTVKFGNTLLLVRNADPSTILVFGSGMIYPALLYDDQTTSKNNDPSDIAYTLSIRNLTELNNFKHQPNSRIFSFLLWEEKMANPLLYLFELTNTELNREVTLEDFLKKSKLTAFGFCSILI